MKKTVSLLLAIVMLFSLTVCLSLSASAETSGDFEYTVLEDGTAEITGYTGEAISLSIPESLDGYTVTSIGEYAFSKYPDMSSFTSVEIPDSVINICDNAFFRCENLESAVIGKGVCNIGFRAFFGCTSLKELTISEGVDRIESAAFFGCTSITEIVLPNSVTYIDARAFAECTGLESIKMPEGLTYLSSSAFEACSSLKSLVIPAGVQEMEFYQFSGCVKLESIYIMNRDLVFGESRWPLENAVIYGYKGSTAQAYAEKNGIRFVAIDEEDDPAADGNMTDTTTKPSTESTTGNAADKNDPSKSPDTGAGKNLYAFVAVVLAGGAVAFIKKKNNDNV